ncbi:MAG TPA: T9SS type A sorting domain-containing protein, partial [Bacteroidia bacterium]|nr:T9SS type A sorting domain-containing protein [Bacteroidia bacterium]
NDVAQVSSVVYNSTTSHLMVNTHLSKPTILKIYDIKGKWIQSFSIRSGQQNVMLSLRLDPSVYLYQFNNGVTGKLVVQY